MTTCLLVRRRHGNGLPDRIISGLAAGGALLICFARMAAAEISNNDAAFEKWVEFATEQPWSPANAEAGDRVVDWVAPNKRKVHLVVKIPHPTEVRLVTMAEIPEGADARPYFEDALKRAIAERASRLVIPKGTYVFKTLSADKQAHLLIQGLKDITIDGGGSTLLFTQNEVGLCLSANQRLKISQLTLGYTLHMASLGQIQASQNGNVLVIDPRFPVTDADTVTYISEYDPRARNYVRAGERVIFPPGSSPNATFTGNQTYSSPLFKQATPGKTFIVFHQWYGGVALKVADPPGPLQSEDLTLDNITIQSGPGMGILAYGMKRGFAIVNSAIAPKEGAPIPISTEYDAIHILIAGGDVIIGNNRISGQGDDGINFNNVMQPIVSTGGDGTKLTLSAYSRFILPNDSLAFFDGDGNFIAKGEVLRVKPLGGLNNEVTLKEFVPGIGSAVATRDLRMLNSRYVIEGNTIANCHCHAILMQAPYGLAAHNVISGTAYNAVRLMTSFGLFKMGAGAFDVIVRGNEISDTGGDSSLRMPWAAISAYGVARGNTPSATIVNSDIEIVGNKITNVDQGCITIMSSRRVSVSGNSCQRDAIKAGGSSAISVRNAAAISFRQNQLSGAYVRKFDVEASSTTEVHDSDR